MIKRRKIMKNNLKRLLAFFLMLVMVALAVVPLVSCKDDTCTEHVDEDGNLLCDNCGAELEDEGIIPDGNGNVKYTVTVKSSSGKALAGVYVFVSDSADAGFTKYAKTDANGLVTFEMPLKSTYFVELDSVPAGYVVNEKYEFAAGKASLAITLASTLLPETSLSGISFKAGDFMRDFTLTDSKGNTVKLSEVFKTKQAVVLNFWYIDCTWCLKEFPDILEAYESTYVTSTGETRNIKDDIEILGINIGSQDDNLSIEDFKEDMGLTFPTMKDTKGLFSAFGFGGAPSTVIIDKYGMIAVAEEGAVLGSRYWYNAFKYFLDEGYEQQVLPSIMAASPVIKPTETMPSSDEISAVINGSGLSATYRPETDPNDAEYSWPFIITKYDGFDCIKPSNYDVDNSYATIYADVELKAGEALVFDYFSSTEYDPDNGNWDMLYVIVNGKDIASIAGISEAGVWDECCAYVALEDGTYEVALTYVKNISDKVGDDTVYIKNLRTMPKEDVTVKSYIYRYAATDMKPDQTGFNSYVDVVLGSDGYYHVGTADGPLLLANLMGYTLFDGVDYLWNRVLRTVTTNNPLGTFTVNGKNAYHAVEMYSNYAINSDVLYYTPVTEDLRAILEAYVNTFCDVVGKIKEENMWLQLCAYYDAYGREKDGTPVAEMPDPIKGLATFSAFETLVTPEGGEDVLNHVTYNKVIMPRGLFYKFVPEKSGVYRILTDSKYEVNGWIFTGNHEDWVANGGERYFYRDSDLGERLNPDLIVDKDGDGVYERDTTNCSIVAYFEEGKEYYIAIAFYDVYQYGSFDFTVKYAAEEFNFFREASPGPFTYDLVTGNTIAGGINVVLNEDDGYYYHKLGENPDGTPILGSKVYADFIWTTNIFMTRTMQQLINAYAFDFRKTSSDLEALALYNSYAKRGFEQAWRAEFESTVSPDGYTDEEYEQLWEEALEAKWDIYGDEYEIISQGMYEGVYYDDTDFAKAYKEYAIDGLEYHWTPEEFEESWEEYQMDDLLAGKFHGRGEDYTERMQQIFDANIIYTDDTKTDIVYDEGYPERQGCVAVDEELAELLQMLMDKYTFMGIENSWTKLCYYYEYLGPNN